MTLAQVGSEPGRESRDKPDVEGTLTPLPLWKAGLFAAAAVGAFQVAYTFPRLSALILLYLAGLMELVKVRSVRQAFYFGLAVGLATAALQMNSLWIIFGPSAIALWSILAFWIALFVALARTCYVRFGKLGAAFLLPILWTGLEYFRSELYYLRFSWLNIGYVFSETGLLPIFKWLGMYGVGFVLALLGALVQFAVPRPGRGIGLAVLLLLLFAISRPAGKTEPSTNGIQQMGKIPVAGVQLEFPSLPEIVAALNRVIERQPQAELLVLSEYTLDGPVPPAIKSWCRERHRYLVIGGKDAAPGSNFYDTAFIIDPAGQEVFKQVKSVPIQFFKDGLPAPEQNVWHSPWGKIGICICYDLSYTRITDRLVRLGAQAIVVPTMDVTDWGRREHELHARVAPIRSAEYAMPIFRVASSGISQSTDRHGVVVSSAGYPGQSEIIASDLELATGGSLPLDRWLAPISAALTGFLLLVLLAPRRAFRSSPPGSGDPRERPSTQAAA